MSKAPLSPAEQRFRLAAAAAERYERAQAPIMAPFVRALVDRVASAADGASVARGAAETAGREASVAVAGRPVVLDVACGTAYVGRALRAAGFGAVGIDLNPGMLAVARRAVFGGPAGDGAPPPMWCVASADRLPFAPGVFAGVTCQQGVQFLPDLDVALAAMARVARPGAAVAATAFSSLDASPYMAAQLDAILAVTGEPDDASFRAAFTPSPDRLVAAFTRAGLREVVAEELRPAVTLPPLAQFAALQLSAIPWGARVAAARPDGLAAAGAHVTEALAGFADPTGAVTVPFASWLVSGRR